MGMFSLKSLYVFEAAHELLLAKRILVFLNKTITELYIALFPPYWYPCKKSSSSNSNSIVKVSVINILICLLITAFIATKSEQSRTQNPFKMELFSKKTIGSNKNVTYKRALFRSSIDQGWRKSLNQGLSVLSFILYS